MNQIVTERPNTLVVFNTLVPILRRVLEQYEKSREVTRLKCEVADLVLDKLGVSELTQSNKEKVLADVKELLTSRSEQKSDEVTATPDINQILAPFIAMLHLK